MAFPVYEWLPRINQFSIEFLKVINRLWRDRTQLSRKYHFASSKSVRGCGRAFIKTNVPPISVQGTYSEMGRHETFITRWSISLVYYTYNKSALKRNPIALSKLKFQSSAWPCRCCAKRYRGINGVSVITPYFIGSEPEKSQSRNRITVRISVRGRCR